jgi:hypothetical protein
MTGTFPEQMFARARELQSDGLEWLHASGIAWLEERIRQWPPARGDDLHVLVYGDLQPPTAVLTYPSLGITVHPEKQTNTIIRGATMVLEAVVKVKDKSIPALVDAARRINLLLGTWTLHEWGNGGCGWWSWVTHGTGGGVRMKLTHEGIERSTTAILNLPPEARRKVEAALFWVREPRNLVLESYRPDILRVYSSYWNAFECLVEAVCIVRPRPTPSKHEKQTQIDKFVHERRAQLTAEDIQSCYQNIVNPGFVGKASHALNVCFGSVGDRYVHECFRLKPEEARLYNIRNAINHGDIDGENPNELLRVEARFRRLWMIGWRMFGCFIPFPTPVDSEEVA